MLRKLSIISLVLFINGCATYKALPLPPRDESPRIETPASCDFKVAGKCKHSSAADVSGNTTLGHSNNEDLPAKAATAP